MKIHFKKGMHVNFDGYVVSSIEELSEFLQKAHDDREWGHAHHVYFGEDHDCGPDATNVGDVTISRSDDGEEGIIEITGDFPPFTVEKEESEELPLIEP